MDILPSARPARASRTTRKLSLITCVAALVVAVPLSAFAAGGTSVSVGDGVYAGTTVASVSGTTRTSSTPSSMWVRDQCFQGSTRVLTQYVRPDANGHATLTLGPTELWTGGAASCVAEYGSFGSNGRWRALSSAKFSVSA